MNLNKIFIIGRVTKDPEGRALPSGSQVVNLSVATNRTYNDQAGNKQEQTEFHNVVAFGKLAEICQKYLQKGQLVMFEGRMQTRSWEGQDGQRKYKTEILAENMQMGPKVGGNAGAPRSASQNTTAKSAEDEIPVIDADEEEKINVDDIPF